MPLSITMQDRSEFVPEHNEQYIAFLVSDFYGSLDFKYLRCEFQYTMIDADNGFPLPCSMCYEGDDMPFDTPLMFDGQKAYVLTPEQIVERKCHPDPEQRFWWEKTWFLTDRRTQIHPEELDEMSIGIMREKDFMKQVREANVVRRKAKEEQA